MKKSCYLILCIHFVTDSREKVYFSEDVVEVVFTYSLCTCKVSFTVMCLTKLSTVLDLADCFVYYQLLASGKDSQ